jgi:glutamate-1-semialdehyde 2,1-aminomutase
VSGWPVRTEASKQLFARAGVVSPGGVQGEGRSASPYPLFMTRAQGGRIWDVDGHEYIDFHSSFGAVLLGHNDPRVNAAVRRAMDEHGISFSTANPLEVELAERLVTMIPSAEKVVFSCSGSEATYHAIRLARGFTGRERILKFEGNYHGWHDYVAWSHHFAMDADSGDVPVPVPASAGMPAMVRDLVLVREYNDAAGVRDVLAREGDTIAAVIVEPVFHNAGVVLPEPGFLEALREACSRAGTLLIFDEVITGFRYSPGGAQAYFGVTPDMTTLAKIVAGGLPGAAVVGKKELLSMMAHRGDPVFDRSQRVAQNGTFNSNPVCAAAAIATLELVADGSLHARANKAGDELRSGLSDAMKRAGVPGTCFGEASIFHVSFEGKPGLAGFDRPRRGDLYHLLRCALLNNGVDCASHHGWISAVHTDADIERTIAAHEKAFREMAADGVFKGM